MKLRALYLLIMLCELNRTIERVVNLMTCLDFVFVLISFVHLHGIIWRGGGSSFEIGSPKSRGWKHFRCRWGWEVFKIRQLSWTSHVYHPLAFFVLLLTFFPNTHLFPNTFSATRAGMGSREHRH